MCGRDVTERLISDRVFRGHFWGRVNPKENQPEYSLMDWSWSWRSNTLATWSKEPTHWKRPWCWERLKAEGEGGDRGWDGWMASSTQQTWVWASSRRWWRTEKPGMLQSTDARRARHNWATEQQQHGTETDTKRKQEEELSGWRWLSCGFYKACLALWPMAADFSSFAELSIYWSPFSMPGDAGPSGCSCEQERHGFHPKEVYNKVQFLKIKFSWPSISTFAIYLLHHKIRILDCGLGWLWWGELYDHKH